jgi:hypothetical protein
MLLVAKSNRSFLGAWSKDDVESELAETTWEGNSTIPIAYLGTMESTGHVYTSLQ